MQFNKVLAYTNYILMNTYVWFTSWTEHILGLSLWILPGYLQFSLSQ